MPISQSFTSKESLPKEEEMNLNKIMILLARKMYVWGEAGQRIDVDRQL
jgi:hypothetical protein